MAAGGVFHRPLKLIMRLKKEGSDQMRKIWVILLLTALSIGGFQISAMAGSQDFTLVNATGFDIYEVYVSPNNTDSWENEVMEEDILADGDSVNISIDGYNDTFWDVMVKDQDGNAFYWRNLNLKEISTITLYFDGEEAWAETE